MERMTEQWGFLCNDFIPGEQISWQDFPFPLALSYDKFALSLSTTIWHINLQSER